MLFSIISYTLLSQLLFESYTTNYLYGRSFIVNECSSIKKKKKKKVLPSLENKLPFLYIADMQL